VATLEIRLNLLLLNILPTEEKVTFTMLRLPNQADHNREIRATRNQNAFFNDAEITSEHKIAIQRFINENFNELSEKGLEVENAFFVLERDPITLENFVFDADERDPTEWCLFLKGAETQGKKIYVFMCAASLRDTVSSHIYHLYNPGRELKAGDIFRGQHVLDLLKGAQPEVAELPPDPTFFARFMSGQTTRADKMRIEGAKCTVLGITLLALTKYYCSVNQLSFADFPLIPYFFILTAIMFLRRGIPSMLTGGDYVRPNLLRRA